MAALALASKAAWADEPASTPAAPAASPAATTADSPTSAPEGKDSIFLHVASSETVTVQRDDTGETVCTSPCDKAVPAGARYRIGGHRPSPSFVLDGSNNGRADVRVKPGSKTTFWMGVGALGLGGALIGGGIATLLVGRANQNEVAGADGTETDNSYTDAMIVGTGLVLAGTVSALFGGATVIANASTKVRGNLSTEPTATGRSLPSAAPKTATIALPKPTFIPIFGGTF